MMKDVAFPQRQYDALRDGSGYVDLLNWSSVTFTGADRQSFLNSFCTNDVKKLAPGQCCEAFVTNVKGRTVGQGLVDCRPEELVFITVPGQAAALIGHFDRYIIREDVQLRDTSGTRVYFYFGARPPIATAKWIEWKSLGRNSGGLLEGDTEDASRLRQTAFDNKSLSQNRRELAHFAESSEQNVPVPLSADGFGIGPKFMPCDVAAFDALRVEAGTPLFGVDFDESNFPQEVGRDHEAISFTKGCYLGQETVARIDALGHVNQRIVGVRFFGNDVPAAGVELIANGSAVGRVTSATLSSKLGAPLALAMVRREANAVGSQLESAVGPAEVVKLPLEAGS